MCKAYVLICQSCLDEPILYDNSLFFIIIIIMIVKSNLYVA